MNNDGDLLRQFVQTHDESSFTRIVQQHIGFVYAVALRRVRDPHLAQDATQAVFIALARKAASVARDRSVVGWLHRSACYETRNLLRAQAHRVARETEAQRLGMISAGDEPSADFAALEPVLDDALRELSTADREAILARYFSAQSYAQIGATLRLNENTARMRVERALLKLRLRLQRRGIDSTTAALALALPACASAAVPAGTIATITKASLAGFSAGAGAVGLFAFMSTTKIAATAAILAVIAGFVYQNRQTAALAASLSSVREERTTALHQVDELGNQIAALKQRLAQQEHAGQTAATIGPKATAATTPADRPEIPGVTRTAPPGWHKNGSKPGAYDVGVDTLTTWGGMPSAYAASIDKVGNEFGGMMQTTSAEAYKGQRVKLAGWIKTQDATGGGGHLWLRVDGQQRPSLQFDNMDGRAPKGTTDWQEYSVVLDVPPESSTLNYGFFVAGSGKMWVNGFTITPVGNDVPSTDLKSKLPPTPQAPVNLGFAPPATK